jgi:CRISPR-associated protein Cmr4
LGKDHGTLFLEERQFERKGEVGGDLSRLIEGLILHPDTRKRLDGRLVVLHDDDFVWFARYGLAVQARNVLDEVKKTSKNLWYEETIPPDALFYTLWAERNGGALDRISSWFEKQPYLQVGGNETVGQGWFAVKSLDGGVA